MIDFIPLYARLFPPLIAPKTITIRQQALESSPTPTRKQEGEEHGHQYILCNYGSHLLYAGRLVVVGGEVQTRVAGEGRDTPPGRRGLCFVFDPCPDEPCRADRWDNPSHLAGRFYYRRRRRDSFFKPIDPTDSSGESE